MNAHAFYGKERPSHTIIVAALILLFLVLNIAILAGAGIRRGFDTGRYLTGADNLLMGQPFVGKQASYLGYLAVIALSRMTGLGLNGVVTLQLLIASAALAALYDLGRRLGGRWAGVLAAMLLIADLSIDRWHFYILTDSLYISAVVLGTWAACWAAEKRGYRYGPAAIIVLAAALLRPHGWILPPIVGIYWVWTGIHERRWRWAGIGAVLLLSALGIILSGRLQAGVTEESLGTMLAQGEVVWGHAPWRLPMPAGLTSQSSLVDVLGYVLLNPLPVLELMGARLLANFANIRPYYSALHNIRMLAWLIPIYVLAVVALIRMRQNPMTWLIASIIAGHAGIVAVTFADWDGRFVLYVLPLCYLLGACTMKGLRKSALPALRYGAVPLLLIGLPVVAVMRGTEEYSPRSTAVMVGSLPAETIPRSDIFGSEIRLLGFAPLATDHQPGHYSIVTLYWQGLARIPEDYVVTIQLLSRTGERIAWIDQTLGSVSYPQIGTSIWPVGMRLTESYSIYIPGDAPPVLDIYLSLYRPKTQEQLLLTAPDGTTTQEDRIQLGRLGLLAADGLPALDGSLVETDYRLGDSLRITGISLPQQIHPADDLRVGIRIEASRPLYEDYILFFHLLDDAGNPVAQSDGPILSGDWTTAALIPGYPLGASRFIDLPDDLPPGKYRLMTGMYSYPSLDRLPVRDAQGTLLPDNLIEAGYVQVLRE